MPRRRGRLSQAASIQFEAQDHPVQTTVRQKIFETLEAPRLMGLATADFAQFKQDREIFERRVSKKNTDPNNAAQPTSYKDTIDPSVLQIFAICDWFSVHNVEDITEKHLKDCAMARDVVKPKDYDLANLEEELRNLEMHKTHGDTTLESCVWSSVLDYTELLKRLGYEKFIHGHPKLGVEHVLKRISVAQVKKQMVITAKRMKEDDFRKNFNNFVRSMAQEASLMYLVHSA